MGRVLTIDDLCHHKGIVSMGYASRIIDVLACWKGWFTRRGFGDAWCAVPLCLMWLSWKKCNCKAFEGSLHKSIISRGLGCRGGSVNRKQDGQREVCTAMILLKREKSGRWVVRKFVRDHNHPLVVQLQKSRQIIDEKDRKIQELTAELRVKKRLSSAYREQLLKLMKDVEDHNEHLRTKQIVSHQHRAA
nr:hypothetical protein CFP56_10795 [Quercus suber]